MRDNGDMSRGTSVYRRLLRYVAPYKKPFAFSIFGMVVYAATDTAVAALMKPMLDGSFVDRDSGAIHWAPLLLVVVALSRGVGGYLSSYCMALVGRGVVKDLRRGIFDQYLRWPSSRYDASTSGELISRATYVTEQVAQAATSAVTIIVRDSLTIIGLLAWMFYLNWQLTLFFLLVGPLIAVVVAAVNKRFRKISKKLQHSMSEVTHVTEEAIDGQRVVKTFGGQHYEKACFEKINESNRRLHVKMASAKAGSVQLIQLLAVTALAAVIFMFTMEPMPEENTVGTFMSLMVAMAMLLAPMKRLTTVNASLQKGIVAAQNIFEVLDSDPEEDNGTRTTERARGEVEYRNVSFVYDTSKGQVLKEIDLHIKPGQTVAFVGRSGSGKSTLVSLLPRFYNAQSGDIFLDGLDIKSLSLSSLREQLALVDQHVTLFNDTIANNIAYGQQDSVSRADIERAAESAYAMEFINKLPDGLDTMVGENGVLLSGGQRQRLAIARALLKDAPVLILDEATASLDTESERHIQKALDHLMKARTTLVIAHRLSTIENADTILVLDEGAIIERGTHKQLLQQRGIYAELYRMQFNPVTDEA